MLIKALCDYYDILSQNGKTLPVGYSNVEVHYLIALSDDGKVDEIIDCQKRELISTGKNKTKEKKCPVEMIMPERTEKPGINVNYPEHRPVYIFGLNLEDKILTPEDKTDKAKKSHKMFVQENVKFIEGLHSPVIDAYRNFMTSWKPENETENKWLLQLGKDYGKSKFAFCLSGSPDRLLHEEPEFKKKWELVKEQKENEKETKFAQCAVSGNIAPISRIHNKIKGVYGGLATGSVLIGFNNESENSYGNEQSYNSNISETVMKKYTEALNFLLNNVQNRALIDDMTIVYWAMSSEEEYGDFFSRLISGQQEQMEAEQTERMLKDLMEDAAEGRIGEKRLQSWDIDPNVDFYMLGLKPNSSRISVKFLIRKKYADVLWNIAKFQKDIQTTRNFHTVFLWQIKRELVSPKSKNEKVNPALMARLFETIIYDSPLPVSLLETIVRRVKIDGGNEKINAVRAGLVKACINRSSAKEELKVALDERNQDQAYLCGRLFAVLEKLQQDAYGNTLNRTIKDAYFASASAQPALVFPKLIRLAQYHLNKSKYPVFYNKLIGEIIAQLNGAFPEHLVLKEQGKFIVGYYQQYQSFFEKNNNAEEKGLK